jgi:predicted GIY-YIG superfamily endonuclease
MVPNMIRQRPLVAAHIKDVSVAAIQRHLKCFREFIGQRKCGIYVLRTGGDIYYVGLASSLRGRLADHLRDHLQGKWDQFDLYIIRKSKAKYLREIESLLIRVAKPTANRTEPKFVDHNNITKKFEQALYKEAAAQIAALFA